MDEPPKPSRFAQFRTVGSDQPEPGRFTLLSGWIGLILALAIIGAVAGPLVYWFFEAHMERDDLIDHPLGPADVDRRLQLSALIGGLMGIVTGAGCWVASFFLRKSEP